MDYLVKGGLPFKTFSGSLPGGIPTGNYMAVRLTIHLFFKLFSDRVMPHHINLDDIFGRLWITRLWTFQEVLLSGNIVIVCGTRAVPWFSLLLTLHFVETFDRQTAVIFEFPNSFRHWRHLIKLWERYHATAIQEVWQQSQIDNQSLNDTITHHVQFIQKAHRWLGNLCGGYYIAVLLSPHLIVLLGTLVINKTIDLFAKTSEPWAINITGVGLLSFLIMHIVLLSCLIYSEAPYRLVPHDLGSP